MAEQTTFTYELDEEHQNLLLELLSSGNYRPRQVPYSILSVEGDRFNCTLYQKVKHGKRKCCVQGGGAKDFVQFVLETKGVIDVSLGYEDVLDPDRDKAHAGSDESGKGDYFGPLVVACCFVNEEIAEKMREMGVKDCKQMSDRQILAVGAQIRQLLGPQRYAVVKIGNPAYNRLYARIKNINRLLAWAHGTCIEDLLTKQPACPKVVVDQFAPTETVIRRALKERGRKVIVDQHHKAESDIAVAAASVVARELFLRDMVALFTAAGRRAEGAEATTITDALKGSSDPRVRAFAEEMVRKNGPKWLMNNCKAHFQTTDKVLAACGFSRADLPPEGRIASAVANGTYKGRTADRKASGTDAEGESE